jgi:signal transduction histidine kinase
MSRRLIDVQEKESQRLARELHDEIGQNLTFLKLMLDMLPENLSPEMKQKGASSKEIVSSLIGQIRTLAMDLRPSLLDDLGLIHALLAYFERLEVNTGIRVEFAHSRISHRYSSEIETTLYRVIQEALSNVARHAQVKEAWVRIWESQNDLYFQVEDTGIGFVFNNSQYQKSFGLLGMRERVELCNGSLEIDSQPGQGTRVTAWVPLSIDDLGRPDYDNLHHTR